MDTGFPLDTEVTLSSVRILCVQFSIAGMLLGFLVGFQKTEKPYYSPWLLMIRCFDCKISGIVYWI